jgi:hypothetical protein
MKNYRFRGLVGFIVVTSFVFGQTNTPARDQLQQLTGQLQKAPDDQALREQIIALALMMKPKPTMPTAVSQAEGAAEYAFKNAKANSDFSDAAQTVREGVIVGAARRKIAASQRARWAKVKAQQKKACLDQPPPRRTASLKTRSMSVTAC